jgi:hypothetical protein
MHRSGIKILDVYPVEFVIGSSPFHLRGDEPPRDVPHDHKSDFDGKILPTSAL